MSNDPNDPNALEELVGHFPIGTPVLAWTGTRDDAPRWTKTRSEPWRLGHGDWVVAVEGIAGGIALSHIERIPEGWVSPEQHRAEVERYAAISMLATMGMWREQHARAERAEAEVATARREALDEAFRRITADRSAEIDRLGGIGKVRASTALNNWVEGVGIGARHVDDVRHGRPPRADHRPHEAYGSTPAERDPAVTTWDEIRKQREG